MPSAISIRASPISGATKATSSPRPPTIWRRWAGSGDESWGREVKLPPRITGDAIGLAVQHTVSNGPRWAYTRADGGKLPVSTLRASVVAPTASRGRAFLVYDNFRSVMKWNHSTYFALAVGLLSDGIAN